MAEKNSNADQLNDRIEQLAYYLEKARITEYVDLMQNIWKLLFVNFLIGLVRGLGIAVGFSILGAVVIYFLRRLVMFNLPLIGDFIAEIIKLVYQRM